MPTIGNQKQPKKRCYDTSLIAKAYDDVKDHCMSVYSASRKYGIPESTLGDRVLGIQPVTKDDETMPSSGPSTSFSMLEEKQLVQHIKIYVQDRVWVHQPRGGKLGT